MEEGINPEMAIAAFERLEGPGRGYYPSPGNGERFKFNHDARRVNA